MRFSHFLIYLRSKPNWRRDNITVYIQFYSLKSRSVFTVGRSRRKWRIILIRRIWIMSI